MTARRVTLGIVASLWATLLFPQIAFEKSEPDAIPKPAIPNWPVAPFWSPAHSLDVEKGDVEGMGPMAAEGVPTPQVPFTGVAPCRILDTRGNGAPIQGGIYEDGEARNYALPGICDIPAQAQAVSLNITVTGAPSAPPGAFLLAWPQGGAVPPVSILNYQAGQTLANAAIVPLGTAGGITVNVSHSVHVIIDTNGYFAPQTVVNTVNGLSGAVTLAAGTSISITPAGNALTIANTATPPPAAWQLTGNTGTVPPTNYLGTTDGQPLELRVNGTRALRIEPQGTNAANLIGGYSGNTVSPLVQGATIGGGGGLLSENRVTDLGGTVSGGYHNQAGDNAGGTGDRIYSTVGGGLNNTASGSDATIAGGNGNTASGIYGATVGGGHSNVASGGASTVVGGEFNTASGASSTVAGGYNNTAAGLYSFAAGRQVQANHDGTFVWGDTTFAVPPMASTGVNQFIVRSAGGMWFGTTSSPSFDIATDFLRTSTGAHLTIGGVWTDNSDVNSKENFRDVDRYDVLARLASLPIMRWNYKAEGCGVEHLGPMAQDFSAAFGLGDDDRSIGALDSSGVALAAIQGLYELVKEKDAEIETLRTRLSRLEAKVE